MFKYCEYLNYTFSKARNRCQTSRRKLINKSKMILDYSKDLWLSVTNCSWHNIYLEGNHQSGQSQVDMSGWTWRDFFEIPLKFVA